MLHCSRVCCKHPIVFKQGQGMISHQLKRILNKKSLHKYVWDPLPMYDPRKLVHANRYIDHDTYAEKYNPHWSQNAHLVPDQQYYYIPVPKEYKDAYWWRDLQARRVQCPVEWVRFRMIRPQLRECHDFQDLSFRQKFQFTLEEAAANSREMRDEAIQEKEKLYIM